MTRSKEVIIWCNQSVDIHFPPHFKLVYLDLLSKRGVNVQLIAFYRLDKKVLGVCNSIILIKKRLSFVLKIISVFRSLGILFWRLILKYKKVDVVIVHNDPVAAIAALFMSYMFGFKLIYRVTHLIPEDLKKNKKFGSKILGEVSIFLRDFVLRRSKKNIFMSEAMASYLGARGKDIVLASCVPKIKISQTEKSDTVENCPLDIVRFLDSPGLRLVYIGNLDESRDIKFMLDVVHRMVKQGRDSVRLLVLGVESHDFQKTVLERYAIDLDLSERVKFSNPLPYGTLKNVFKYCDVGLCLFPDDPILNCNSPVKVLDYLTHSLPVVVSNNPDAKFVVEESGGGVISDLEAEAIIDAIWKAEAKRKGNTMEISRIWVIEHRSCEVAADQLVEVLFTESKVQNV